MKKSVVTPFRLAALAVLGLAATAAGAQQPPMVTVRVLSAQPVTQQAPMADCGPYGRQPSGAGAAAGALAGGLIGSQVGRGWNGQIAGTVLGAIGGAIVGNAAEASQTPGCVTRYGQQVIGYDVTYEYAGRQYSTRMGSPPPSQWIQMPMPDPSGGAYVDSPPAYGAAPPPAIAYQDNPGDPNAAAIQPPPGAAPAPPPPGYYDNNGNAYPGNAYPYPPPPAPAPGYPQGYYPPPPAGYPVYPAPVYVQPAPPVYVAPPVGVGLSIGGRVGGYHRGGVGVGIGIGN